MIEMMFGSGSPMWTAMPPATLGYQPIAMNSRPIGAPMFTPPLSGGGLAGGTSSPQGLPGQGTPSPGLYGYGAFAPGTQQSLAGSGLAVAYPVAANPGALIGADATGFVTAQSLLTAVALRRGQPQGPANDQEVEEFIYDALDLLPGASDVEVRCEAGRVTLTGSVLHKRTKRDIGEIAWTIPGLLDVQNNVSIASRRRARAASRDAEVPQSVSARKQS